MKSKVSELINGLAYLKGLIDGIVADGDVSPSEVSQLQDWMGQYGDFMLEKPFVDCIWIIQDMIETSDYDMEKILEAQTLIDNILSKSEYANRDSTKVHTFQGMCTGILMDGTISHYEVSEIRDWINRNSSLQKHSTIKKIFTKIEKVLEDGIIDNKERNELSQMFKQIFDRKIE